MRRRQSYNRDENPVYNNSTNERKVKKIFLPEPPTPEVPAIELSKNICPKCFKVFKRGMYMHQKHCKGPVND